MFSLHSKSQIRESAEWTEEMLCLEGTDCWLNKPPTGKQSEKWKQGERENQVPNTKREFNLYTSVNGAEIFNIWNKQTILFSFLWILCLPHNLKEAFCCPLLHNWILIVLLIKKYIKCDNYHSSISILIILVWERYENIKDKSKDVFWNSFCDLELLKISEMDVFSSSVK